MKRLALLLLLVASPALADHITYSPGTKVTISNATVTLVADASGELQVTAIATGGTVVPDPTPDPDPVPVPGGFLEKMTAATKAVPAYPTKDEDARSMAVVASRIAPYLPGNGKVPAGMTPALKKMADEGLGANAGKWTAWWKTFDNETKNMTVPQYKEALGVVASALTVDSNFASGEFMGGESFGLDLAKLMKLIELILKYLPIIMTLFA